MPMNHLVAALSQAASGTEIQAVREMSQGRKADRLSDRLGFGHRLPTWWRRSKGFVDGQARMSSKLPSKRAGNVSQRSHAWPSEPPASPESPMLPYRAF